MWQQRDQELALTRERERATKEKERQRREREGIWPGIGGIGSVLNDHIELDKESYSYVQFAREGNLIIFKLSSKFLKQKNSWALVDRQYWSGFALSPFAARVQLSSDARSSDVEAKSTRDNTGSPRLFEQLEKESHDVSQQLFQHGDHSAHVAQQNWPREKETTRQQQ